MTKPTIPGLAGASNNKIAGRNASVDGFRGLLLILVILGHYSELTQRHILVTWLGSGFRMPLFIGLTGYLFNLEYARSSPLAALGRKYYRRLILPWALACTFYRLTAGSLSWLTPLDVLMRPPAHLWFVPVMMAFIVTARACRVSTTVMLAVATPISVVAMYIFGFGHYAEPYYSWIPDRRYFTLPIYFSFGLWLARHPLKPEVGRIGSLFALIGFSWWAWLYSHPSRAGEIAAELVLCLPLITLIPFVRSLRLHHPLIVEIGRNSLFFYLWHPLAFALCVESGLSGLYMLVISMLGMALAWLIIRPFPLLQTLLGIRSADDIGRNEAMAIAGHAPPAQAR